nr:putative mitochondrial protein [Tanacetum cinerariifolium]
MVNLEFCEQHNMVAFLKKPQGSINFHQIVDFLNSTHIKYALTKNPVIYVSLIHQFLETASLSKSENGLIKITATIDGRVKYVTKASIRRHLKLEDSKGISNLHNTEIFEQLALMGVAPPPHDSPLPRGNTPGRANGRMTLNELTVLGTSLAKKVESLESDLKQIKLTYGATYSNLIMKLKKLENKTQGKNEHEVEFDFDFTTAKDISTANVPVTIVGAKISSASPEDKTVETSDDSDAITLAETLIEIRRSSTKPQKDNGKGVLVEEEHVKVKRRDQVLAQIESDVELDQRLYEEELEEVDKAQKERQKQEEATIVIFTDEIQAIIDVDPLEENNDAEKEELRAILDIVPRDNIAINVESLATKYPIVDCKTYILTENTMYYQIIRADESSKNYKIFSEMLDDFNRQDMIDLHRLVQESSGLMQNIPSSTLYISPTKNDWEMLFQPMFYEYFKPPSCVDLQEPVVLAPKPIVSTGTPSSTITDHDIEVADMDNNPYIYKEALTKSCWIEAMQEELDEFERLEVWELYQLNPTEKHLHVIKRIFRYLGGTINMGMWYSKDSCIALTVFADADHAGCQDTKKVRLEVCSYWVTNYNKLGMQSMSLETLKKLADEEEE